jgi:hypothetical protein
MEEIVSEFALQIKFQVCPELLTHQKKLNLDNLIMDLELK